MISFVDINDIGSEFARIVALGVEARQALADERSRIFRERFDPKRVAIEAGIDKLISSDPSSVATYRQK